LTDFLEHWASDSPQNAKPAAQELLIAEVTESIWQAMKQAGVNQTDLAKRMGATRGPRLPVAERFAQHDAAYVGR
jgi:hypothetical protein